jgi:hypothetical protein
MRDGKMRAQNLHTGLDLFLPLTQRSRWANCCEPNFPAACMSNNRHRSRWYGPLKYLFLPGVLLAFEIWHWKKLGLIPRCILSAVVFTVGAWMLIWWQVDRTNRRKRIPHRRRRRRDDFR